MGLSMGHAIYPQDFTVMLTTDLKRLCHLSFAMMSVTPVQHKYTGLADLQAGRRARIYQWMQRGDQCEAGFDKRLSLASRISLREALFIILDISI